MPPTMPPAEDSPAEPLFSARNLWKTFPPAGDGPPAAVLAGVDLDIWPGECVVVAGPNGSGKTVLMKILAGLADPSSGEIRYRGTPLPKIRNLRSAVGLVFQDADSQIIGETALEDAAFGPRNLGLSQEAALGAARAALEAAGLGGKEDLPARHFSGGEKRRLAVAGIVAMGCETLIFDEPFANLDWPGIKSALGIIRSLKGEGRTLIVLTHDLERILPLADRLVILQGGRVREDGRPAEVLSRLRDEYGLRRGEG